MQQNRNKKFLSLVLFIPLVALLFQNCGNINVNHPVDQLSVPEPDPAPIASPTPDPAPSPVAAPLPTPAPAAVPAPQDSVNYTNSSLNDPPGGTDPAESDNIKWFSDLIYGNTTDPINCHAKNFDTDTDQPFPLTIVTGIRGNGSGWSVTGTSPINYFEIGAMNYDVRFAPQQGVHAYRIKTSKVAKAITLNMQQGGGAGFIAYDEENDRFINRGVVASFSRKPCDFRESTTSENILAADYCTVGNSYTQSLAINFSASVLPTAPYAGCTLEADVYYYLNVLVTSDFDPAGRYFFSLRSN